MSDTDGIDDAFLSVGIMPDTLVQFFDGRPFVEYGVHFLDLEVSVPTSLTQVVNQLLVVAVRFDGGIVEDRKPPLADEVGNAVRHDQRIEQVRESSAVQPARSGCHAQFLGMGVTRPKFLIAFGQGMMGLVDDYQCRRIVDVVPVA